MRLPRRTARLRLTVLYGGLFVLFGVALVASTYVLFQRVTAAKAPQLPQIPHTPAIHKLPAPSPALAFSSLYRAQHLLESDQQSIRELPLGASGVGPHLLRVSPVLVQDEHQLAQDQRKLAKATHELARAVRRASRAGTVQAAQRASDSHQLLVDSGIALAIVASFAVLAGWLVAGRMLRPIRAISRTARRISSSSLHERLAFDGPDDELKELGDTLDDLFARLEAAFEAQRRFVAHASHELRTPLTRERTLVQVALGDPSTTDVWRATGHELLASNREQESMIDALLTLASSEGGLDQRETADLAEIADITVRNRREAYGPGPQFDLALEPATVNGDPRLLERLVANLVDNALMHNVEGGRVRVSTGSNDGTTVLAVSNTGPVIPSTEVDRLFQPFQRLDPDRIHRNGHGLGLSVVRAIAIAHGATITARPDPDGGITIEIDFP
jgi:signal transduction histidine kinase